MPLDRASRRRLALSGAWFVSTAVAMGVAWAGVGLVANEVTDPLPPVVTALGEPTVPDAAPSEDDPANAPPAIDESPRATASEEPDATPTPAATSRSDPASTQASPRPTPRTTTAAPSATPPRSSTPGPTPAPTATPTPTPRPKPSPSPTEDDGDADRTRETRTVQAIGGGASFEFLFGDDEDGQVKLLWATPEAGFSVDVDREDDKVVVTFASAGHTTKVEADFEGGEPRVRVDEDEDD